MITYEKGKGTTYTGFDKFQKNVSDGVRKAVNVIPNALKRKRKADAVKELDNITRGFGSPENYEKMYPDTKKRNDELRRRAGY